MSSLEELEDESGDEVEAMTAAEVLNKLEEAWRNEKFAEDLLDAKTDLVECMMEQISEMEDNIQRAKKGDFKVSIHRLEIDRIRYVLSSYLRCRLTKIKHFTVQEDKCELILQSSFQIEKFATHLLEEEKQRKEDEPSRLSAEEFTFAKDYAKSFESHLRNLALRHMPAHIQTLDPKQTAVRPNLDKYVFLRVNEDTEGVLVEEETLDTGEEIVDMRKGDQHIMRYRPVAPLVASGVVSLI